MKLLVLDIENNYKEIEDKFKALFNDDTELQIELTEDYSDDVLIKYSSENNYDCLLIPIKKNSSDAFQLSFRVRLLDIFKSSTIIILSNEALHEYNDTNNINIQNFYNTKDSNIHFKQLDKHSFIKNDIKKSINRFIDENNKNNKEIRLRTVIKNHPVIDKNKGDDRHSIANEYGVIQLANHFGYSCQDISFPVKKDLHYLYTQKKTEIENKSEDSLLSLLKNERDDIYQLIKKECCLINNNQVSLSKLGFKKILLIDDNAKKGWENLLNKIFGVKVETSLNLDHAEELDFKNFDLILLDYKLPKNDNDSKLLPSTNLLESIKEKSPATPVIIFTASNKYKKIQQCINLGADGVYIKISPENIGQKTREQTLKFVSLLYQISITYKKTLKPLYEYIDDLPNHYLSIIKNHNTGYDISRIDERLKMFYKTLKNEYISSEYEQKSDFISHLEISFLILWSVLNEIQNVLFKGESWQDYLNNNNISYDKKVNDFNEWIDSYTDEKYIEALFLIDKNAFCVDVKYQLNYDLDERTKKYSKCTKQVNYKGYTSAKQTLKKCISFLISNRNKSTDRDNYLDEIHKINTIRNNLFLIHGPHIIDSPASKLSNYINKKQLNQKHDKSVKSHTTDIKKNILSLLNIISFLLTDDVTKKTNFNL